MKITIELADYLNTVLALERRKHFLRTRGKAGGVRDECLLEKKRAESLVGKVFVCADFTCVLLCEHIKLPVK